MLYAQDLEKLASLPALNVSRAPAQSKLRGRGQVFQYQHVENTARGRVGRRMSRTGEIGKFETLLIFPVTNGSFHKFHCKMGVFSAIRTRDWISGIQCGVCLE
jgi:hypothetical protein